jgi:hypothetical protein
MAKLTQRSFFVKYYSKAFSTLPGIAGGLARELSKQHRKIMSDRARMTVFLIAFASF